MPCCSLHSSWTTPLWVAALVLGTCLPQVGYACVACRQAAVSTVYGTDFVGNLLVLLVPIALLLVVGLIVYRFGFPVVRPTRRLTDAR